MSSASEITVDATLESLQAIGDFVADCVDRLGGDAKLSFDVQLVVDEACTNVIRHAYEDKGGDIVVNCRREGDDFVVSIRDHGKPFDPNAVAAPDLDTDLGERRIGGLGIYFMHQKMDEVDYTFDPLRGNELTMRKKIVQG